MDTVVPTGAPSERAEVVGNGANMRPGPGLALWGCSGSAVLLPFHSQWVREEQFHGQQCAVWQNISYWGHKKNVYTLWVGSSEHGPVPLHYEVRGYNSLLGSHYDKYQIEYSTFGHHFAPSIFQLPHGEQLLPPQSPPGDVPA